MNVFADSYPTLIRNCASINVDSNAFHDSSKKNALLGPIASLLPAVYEFPFFGITPAEFIPQILKQLYINSLKVESGINPNYRPKDYKALEDEFEIIKDSDKSFKQMLTLKHQPELKYSSHIGLLQFFECLSHFVDGLPFPDKFRETMKKMLMVSKMEQIGDVSEYTLALLKEANLKELCDDIPALSIKLSNLSSEARTIINKIYAKAVLNSGLPINAPAGILVLLTQLLE
ncbi:hypothetical protein C6P42_005259, partial [Pichia californica]